MQKEGTLLQQMGTMVRMVYHEFGSDIHVCPGMNGNHFVDPMIFSSSPIIWLEFEVVQ